jgi:hypothetical protein
MEKVRVDRERRSAIDQFDKASVDGAIDDVKQRRRDRQREAYRR